MDRHPSANQARPVPQARKAPWPQGATAGLLLVAALCLVAATALYQVAGPRDVFAAEIAPSPR